MNQRLAALQEEPDVNLPTFCEKDAEFVHRKINLYRLTKVKFFNDAKVNIHNMNVILTFVDYVNQIEVANSRKYKIAIDFGTGIEKSQQWIKTGTEITVKQTAKLNGKLNYLRLQFQQASLFLNIMDYEKAQAAKLRGRNTMMLMNKTAIPEINWQVAKLRANNASKLIQIP
ncbi:MAG: hypothetical protein EZS28_021203 [Streblomastix strix]|uniref:Uncharacterized protein n=1 Tax=Streblomastix strix TaxID=222440 RepID=A0A5J4VKZ5_9EUKA|nr:MAG: hypothetical protein EZS28_021203 [Streblomastix strix]